MRHDPLKTVARLRHLARDEARQALADASANAITTATLAQAALRHIAEETAIAADIASDDAVVEAFGAWLPAARQRAADACATGDRAEAEVARLRAVLAASRSAAEAVDTLIAERAARHAEARERRIQHELEDIRQPDDAP